MKPVSVIIIGAGNRARAYAEYSQYFPRDMRISAVIDPDEEKRSSFQADFQVPYSFASFREAEEKTVRADGAIITSPDRTHFSLAGECIKAGIHFLLEKPIAATAEECKELVSLGEKSGLIIGVCHVLRYSPFFKKVKEITDSGTLGDIASIEHIEAVRYWHQAHSFVRGNWNNSGNSSPMILAKSCHDMDILRWICGSSCLRISSFGSLLHFRKENAPDGSTERCTDGCKAESECPYSACKLYLNPAVTGWPVTAITSDLSPEGRLKALREGPYGLCVYRCGNDVVDHQIVSMEFKNGITASFTMCAFTGDGTDRRIRIMGTRGELIGEKNIIEVTSFQNDQKAVYDVTPRGVNTFSKHGGGDFGLLRDFISSVREGKSAQLSSSLEVSLESHIMAFAAEESRISGKTIFLKN